MVYQAFLNTGLALCLVFQASLPCCCAFHETPLSGGSEACGHRCPGCPAPIDSSNPDCQICSLLGQVSSLSCRDNELSCSELPASSGLQLTPTTAARGLTPHAVCLCGAIPLCNVNETQKLRE